MEIGIPAPQDAPDFIPLPFAVPDHDATIPMPVSENPLSTFLGSPILDTRLPREILETGERFKRPEVVNLGDIEIDFSLVDEDHAADLADSMKKDWGQIQAISVRARDHEGKIVYDIIDGFHRTDAKKKNGDETIDAIVMYGISDEELYDLRILAASSVKSVQFARMNEWMRRSFDHSEWAGKGITLTQAFSLAVVDSDRTRHAGISDEDLPRIKDWAREKSIKWQRSISSVFQSLRLVEDSDPELVKSVRTGTSGGKDRKAVLLQGMLQSITSSFPGEANFHVQRAIVKYALEHRFNTGDTKTFVSRFAGSIDRDASESEILAQIPVLIEAFESELPEPDENEVLEDEDDSLESESESEEGFRDVSDELAHPLIELHKGLETALQERNGKSQTHIRAGFAGGETSRRLQGVRDSVDPELRPYIERIRELEAQVSNPETGDWKFWKNASYLTPPERRMMDLFFGDTLFSLDEIAEKMQTTESWLMLSLRSVIVKRNRAARGELLRPERSNIENFESSTALDDIVDDEEMEAEEDSASPEPELVHPFDRK